MDYQRENSNHLMGDNQPPSGELHRQSHLDLGRGDSELTLKRLKKLLKTLLTREQRSRFEEKNFCGSNLVKILVDHLSHECERARYLALELLCSAVPRLDYRMDSLLVPILPKVMLCFQEAKMKDTQLKALHFFRSFLRHTNDKSSFTDQFIVLGTKLESIASQISFFHGLSIVFDQNIDDDLYSHLIPQLGRVLLTNSNMQSRLSVYRALKRIHEFMGDEDFNRVLLSDSPKAQNMYTKLHKFEKDDPYLNSDINNLSDLVRQYLRKCSLMRFEKAFGIVDCALLAKIVKTQDCKMAAVVEKLAITFKNVFSDGFDLECHLTDALKLVCALLLNSNSQIQMNGFEILQDIASKKGFYLAPYISHLTGVLRECLTSSDGEIKAKTAKLIGKLMCLIHPMTIIRELLKTNDAHQKEAVLRLMFKELMCFPYYYFDLIALSNCMRFHMEDSNPAIRKAAEDCMIVMLFMMKTSPVLRIRAEASDLIMHNYHLLRGLTEFMKKHEVQGDFDSRQDNGPTEATSSTDCVSLQTEASCGTFWQDWVMEKGNLNTAPTSSTILPHNSARTLQNISRLENERNSRKGNEAAISQRLAEFEMRQSNLHLSESEMSIFKAKISNKVHLEKTIDFACTMTSNYCEGDSFRVKNEQPAGLENKDEEYQKYHFVGGGDLYDDIKHAVIESNNVDHRNSTPIIQEDEDHLEDDKKHEKEDRKMKLVNVKSTPKLRNGKARKALLVPLQDDIKSEKALKEKAIPHNANTNIKLDGSPWKKDVEFALKGEMPQWVKKFEEVVMAIKPFATAEMADEALQKSVEDLFGNSWKLKEEAMLNVIRLTKHHPEIVSDNSTKILNAVSKEVKNNRQLVASKAIFTLAFIFQRLGKRCENKLKLVIGPLLAKSGDRTLASYFRLVIESLFKIVESTSPQKAAQAFINEGSKHSNKACREIAAQFLVILTDKMGSLESISKTQSDEMVLCASLFASDCSAITRYCGKRILQTFRKSSSFDKIKNQYLELNSDKDMLKVFELVETKGINEEVLPINIIKGL